MDLSGEEETPIAMDSSVDRHMGKNRTERGGLDGSEMGKNLAFLMKRDDKNTAEKIIQTPPRVPAPIK